MKFRSRNNYLVNWPEYTLLRVTVCFILGIVSSDFVSVRLEIVFSVLCFLFLLAVFQNLEASQSNVLIRSVCVLLYCISFIIGMTRGELQNVKNHAIHFEKFIKPHNQLTGRIDSELKKKKRISTTIEVLEINGFSSSGKLLVYFSEADSIIPYRKGDILKFEGRIQKIKKNSNPKAFNYKQFLRYKGVHGQLFLQDGGFTLLVKNGENSIQQYANQIRWWALSIFKKRLVDKDQLATASAMVLGHRANLSKELYTSFSETGAVHVLAVSGLHVGIVCMLFMVLFRQFEYDNRFYKLFKTIVLLTVVWTYAMVSGGSPAVLRASVMFSIIFIGKMWFRGANIYNALAFSVIILLMYDPYLLFQLSFQFSYLALISILFFQPRIERLFEVKNWVLNRIWQLVSVSLAAQILVFPISIYYFNEFPTYFILSGVAAVFLATFILGLGLFLLCVDQVPVFGDIIADGYSKLLEWFLTIISWIQSLPYTKVESVYFSLSSVVILYILLLTIMFLMATRPQSYKDVFYAKRRRKMVASYIVLGCLLLLINNNLIFHYRAVSQNDLIIYDINGDSCIDLFLGHHTYTFQSDEIKKGKIEFASKSYRNYNGSVTEDKVFRWHQLDDLCAPIISDKNGLAIVNNTKLLFAGYVDTTIKFARNSDFVLVTHKALIDPEEFLASHFTKMVVIDNSMDFHSKVRWKNTCQLKGIPIYDIYESGSFSINMNTL